MHVELYGCAGRPGRLCRLCRHDEIVEVFIRTDCGFQLLHTGDIEET